MKAICKCGEWIEVADAWQGVNLILNEGWEISNDGKILLCPNCVNKNKYMQKIIEEFLEQEKSNIPNLTNATKLLNEFAQFLRDNKYSVYRFGCDLEETKCENTLKNEYSFYKPSFDLPVLPKLEDKTNANYIPEKLNKDLHNIPTVTSNSFQETLKEITFSKAEWEAKKNEFFEISRFVILDPRGELAKKVFQKMGENGWSLIVLQPNLVDQTDSELKYKVTAKWYLNGQLRSDEQYAEALKKVIERFIPSSTEGEKSQ